MKIADWSILLSLIRHWKGEVSFVRLVVWYYVLIRIVALLFVPVAAIMTHGHMTNDQVSLFANAAILPFLGIVYSWVLLWRNARKAQHRISTLLIKLLIVMEIMLVIYFVELYQV